MRVYQRAALVGTGHIGGSLFLSLRERGVVKHAVGFDRDPEAAARAVSLGIVGERVSSLTECVAGADLVVIATPVGATAEVARAIAGGLEKGCLVLDVGSTKARVVAEVEAALSGSNAAGWFVGCHPMAGTERSGPDAADGAMFASRKVVLTPTGNTDSQAIAAAEALWREAGAEVVQMPAELHDRAVCAISHLPHAAAFSLAAATGRFLDGDDVLSRWAARLAGTSFADTTRVAASDAAMWRDIFLDNKDAVLAATAMLVEELGVLRSAVEREDGAAITELIERGRRARSAIAGGPR